MKVRYSRHIESRLKLRGIDPDLPKQIFEEAAERYLDTETGHFVAVTTKPLYGRDREVMVAYAIEEDSVILLTIHPLKDGQKDSRIRSGRWKTLS
jgi:hypothetical protein